MSNTALAHCTFVPVVRLAGRPGSFPTAADERAARGFFARILAAHPGVVTIPPEEAISKAVADFLDAFRNTHIRELKDTDTGLSIVGYLDHLDRSQVESVVVRRANELAEIKRLAA